MGSHKEPHFFSEDFSDFRHVRHLQDYLDLYPADVTSRYMLDASTNYIYSENAIQNILEYDPSAKFIVAVRHPADLIRSLHQHFVFRQIETETDLSKAWKLGRVGLRAPEFVQQHPYPSHATYLEAGRLGFYLNRIVAQVPNQQLKICFFEDLKSDSMKFYKGVLDFLELEFDESKQFTSKNPARTSRNRFLNRLFFYPSPGMKKLKQFVKRLPLIKHWNVQSIMTRTNNKNEMSASLRNDIIDYFYEDIRLLSEVCSRDLSGWLDKDLP